MLQGDLLEVAELSCVSDYVKMLVVIDEELYQNLEAVELAYESTRLTDPTHRAIYENSKTTHCCCATDCRRNADAIITNKSKTTRYITQSI